METKTIKNELIIFFIFFIMFIISTSMLCLDIEPAKGSTEVPENLNPDITDIRLLCSGIGAIGTIVSATLILTSIKNTNKNEDKIEKIFMNPFIVGFFITIFLFLWFRSVI